MGETLRLVSGKTAYHAATIIGERTRHETLGLVGPQLMGDVLAYTRHRTKIHRIVRKAINELGVAELVAVGHSLGGIILVDMLAEKPDPRVKALVTVGSQAAVMFAFDALEGLPFRYNHPRMLPPWINVWDRKDFLSFKCHEIFTSTTRGDQSILDVEVASNEYFPASHNAYWDQNGTWMAIALASLSFGQGDDSIEIPSGMMKAIELRRWLDELGDAKFAKWAVRADEALAELQLDAERLNSSAQQAIDRADALARRTEAIVAVTDIDRGRHAPIRMESSGVQYYQVGSDRYILATGDIDQGQAAALIHAATPLLDGSGSVTLVADELGAVTHEGRALLASSQLAVFYRLVKPD